MNTNIHRIRRVLASRLLAGTALGLVAVHVFAAGPTASARDSAGTTSSSVAPADTTPAPATSVSARPEVRADIRVSAPVTMPMAAVAPAAIGSAPVAMILKKGPKKHASLPMLAPLPESGDCTDDYRLVRINSVKVSTIAEAPGVVYRYIGDHGMFGAAVAKSSDAQKAHLASGHDVCLLVDGKM